jgi:hypothetical protein
MMRRFFLMSAASSLPSLFGGRADLGLVRVGEVLRAVLDFALRAPLAQLLHEVRVVFQEAVGPDARMLHVEPVQRARVVQQGHEAGPGAVEVAEEELRAFVGLERAADVVGVGPAAQHDDDGGLRIDLREDRRAFGLAVMKPCFFFASYFVAISVL